MIEALFNIAVTIALITGIVMMLVFLTALVLIILDELRK